MDATERCAYSSGAKQNSRRLLFWLPALAMLASVLVGCWSPIAGRPGLASVGGSDVDWRTASPQVLAEMIRGWGRRGPDYDEAVVRCLLSKEFAATCVRDSEKPLQAFIDRIAEDEALLGQLAWYSTWQVGEGFRKHGMLDGNGQLRMKSQELPLVKEARLVAACDTAEEKLSALILMSSEYHRADVLIGLTRNNLDSRWERFLAWVEANAPFAVYSESDTCYVLDRVAKAHGQPVERQRQERPFPATRLPSQQQNATRTANKP